MQPSGSFSSDSHEYKEYKFSGITLSGKKD